ncbi:hypothetical protein [Dyella acidiphila]|uniref:Type 1 fimbrial protein n=1 Tax=Dyella acidiphila TaxID=2775866 RepID=A0ABR9G5S7_9GAMM|nr:hypothetical protein [Dyella acidiphila]MBE1159380.1 hypothetical protein [Dyella acidiphila]
MASLLCAPVAAASGGGNVVEGGTISFVGAIVEPTCGVAVQSTELNAMVDASVAAQHSCVAAGGQSTDVQSIYAQSVVRLSDTEQDKVLNYFSGYVRSGSPTASAPVLVTQTYE